MQVPFLDLRAQYLSIKDEIDAAIQGILDKSAFILGEAVYGFEKEFAKAHNVEHCVALNSGTAANHVAAWALGIKADNEVIIPVNTFIATAWGPILCGAKPVFVDCEPDSYNINADLIEEKITPKTKAIIAVHLFGQPADMGHIKEIADKHNIKLIEDSAQSHLAEYKGKKVGVFGEAASFSFYPGKNLGAYGEGGAVVTNNHDLAKRMQMIRDHGSIEKYKHEIFGHNYRMEGFQGAILGIKLKYLESWIEKRRSAASKYNNLLSSNKNIKLPKEMPYSKHVYHLYVIQVTGYGQKSNLELRNSLANYLKDRGIGTGLHYPIPLHLQKCFNYLGYRYGDFPEAEKLADGCLSLPIYPEINEEQIEYVCTHINNFFD